MCCIVRKLVLISVIVLTCFTQKLYAALPVIDPANLVQSIIAVAHLIKSNINEAVMIKQQIESLINEARNLESLPFDIVAEFEGKYQKFYETLGSINGLIQNLSELEGKFEEIYPDYSKEPFRERRDRMAGRILNRVQKTREMIQGSLKTSATVLDGLPTTEKQLKELVSNSQGAVGILQATQAGNQIVADVAGQLMELNGQLATYIQAQSAYILEHNGKQTMAESRKLQVLEDWPTTYTPNPIPENPF